MLPSPYSLERTLPDTTICKGQQITLGRDYNIDGLQYRWGTGDTGCCITVINSGTYTLEIATEKCGSITDTALVNTKDCDNCLVLPNAFTPNADGLNDVFRPVLFCPVTGFSISIYNRWGQQVYHATDATRGWNGLHGPSLADVGTYFYYMQYTNVSSGKIISLKGDLLLLR